MRRLMLVIPNWRYGNHVSLIRASGQNTAINRFDSLSVSNRGVETAGEIHGHVIAAKGEAVGMDELTSGKNRQSRGSSANIHSRRPEIGLIVR